MMKNEKQNPTIKIFSSQRIDVDSILIENEIMQPIRCGAIFDNREDIDTKILGDNTGENISNKRLSYCELTVQYWAWKNIDLDYYGFCHYRRFFSWSNERYEENILKVVWETQLTPNKIKKYHLDDTEAMYRAIEQYDIITVPPMDFTQTSFKTVYEYYVNNPDWYEVSNMDVIKEIVKEKYPLYYDELIEHFNGHYAYYYNSYIMRKDIFFEYCTWMFDILSEFEKRVDMSHYSQEKLRAPGVLAERLFGVFLSHIKKQNKYRIGELQFVFFNNTERAQSFMPFKENNNIPIFISSSDYFCPYASVTVQSILENASPNRNYDIIILHSSISEKNKIKLQKMVEGKENFSLRFYNVKNAIEGLPFQTNSYISVETYFRLLIPTFFQEYSKALFLDADTIVLKDVADLFDIDIANNLLGATVDIHGMTLVNGNKAEHDNFKDYLINQLHLKNPYEYYQAGVLILNLDEFRSQFSTDEILKFALSKKYVFLDQDILNSLCHGKVIRIHMKWDVLPNWGNYRRLYAPASDYAEFVEAQKDPSIVHFAGPGKPWDWPDNELAEVFWKYAQFSPFYGNIMQRFTETVVQRKLEENKSNNVALEPSSVCEAHKEVVPEQVSESFKQKVKRKLVIPIVDMLLPKGSNRRHKVKKVYFRLRGWECY